MTNCAIPHLYLDLSDSESEEGGSSFSSNVNSMIEESSDNCGDCLKRKLSLTNALDQKLYEIEMDLISGVTPVKPNVSEPFKRQSVIVSSHLRKTNPNSQHLLLSDKLGPIPKGQQQLKLRIISKLNDVILVWDFSEFVDYNTVSLYRLFAKNSDSDWLEVGDISSMRLPMGCHLKLADPLEKYHFKIQPVFATTGLGLCSNECSLRI